MSVLEVCGWITGIAAAIGVIAKLVHSTREMAKKTDVLMDGMRCLLRSEMTRTYYNHQDNKTMRQYEFENFIDNYEAYKVLGGNTFIDKCKADIETWEVKS